MSIFGFDPLTALKAAALAVVATVTTSISILAILHVGMDLSGAAGGGSGGDAVFVLGAGVIAGFVAVWAWNALFDVTR